MKAAAEKGRWTFPTPLGYRRAFKPNGTKTIEPEPEVAPLIRKAFGWLPPASTSWSTSSTRCGSAGSEAAGA
jgi:hypothetical protein